MSEEGITSQEIREAVQILRDNEIKGDIYLPLLENLQQDVQRGLITEEEFWRIANGDS